MYRVRYRFCDQADKEFRLEGGAREQAKIHNGLIHHDDGRQCAHAERVLDDQAPRREGVTQA